MFSLLANIVYSCCKNKKGVIMGDCKFCKNERVLGIVHELCTNETMKQINHSDKDIPCMGKECGQFVNSEMTNSEKTER